MRLIVLNGLTVRPFFDGRIQQYLPGSTEIFKWNWRPRDASAVIDKITDDSYVLIGFSDGATLSHQVAMQDKRCVGLVAHSTMFAPPDTLRNIPVLLLRTEGDKTPCYKQTMEMFQWYNEPERELTLTSNIITTLPFTEPRNWYERAFRHQFHNGVELISEWLGRF
jgi:hypothetical protein